MNNLSLFSKLQLYCGLFGARYILAGIMTMKGEKLFPGTLMTPVSSLVILTSFYAHFKRGNGNEKTWPTNHSGY